MPADLHLLRPQWLLALLALLPLLALLWRRRTPDSVWHRLVAPHLLPHLLVGAEGTPRRLPIVLLGLGWLLGVLALAGPVWERLPEPVYTADLQRVVLLDLSPSMNAADLRPSRLARARFELLDLLKASDEGQVALIAYGPEPFLVSPLTGDARTVAAQVPDLSSDLIPFPGPRRTDRALEQARELLERAGARSGQVILITDGLGEASGDGAAARAAVKALAADGYRVSVLGVGTPQGAPVPGRDGGFADDATGAIPMARLDRAGLAALAQAGGGVYVEPDPGDADTRRLLGAGPPLQTAGLSEQEGLAADRWREEGPWLLLLLLPLAALAFRRGWLLPALLLVLILPPGPGWAASGATRDGSPSGAGSDGTEGGEPGWTSAWQRLWQRPDQRAAQAFAEGDGAAAVGDLADPAWRAAARYRAGDYAGALADLQGAAGAEADYNRGNALARLGRLDEAIAAYDRTLAQDPEHADARANRDLVRRLKERSPPPEASQDPGSQSAEGAQGGEGQPGGQDGGQQGQSGSPSAGSDPSAADETGEASGGQQGGGAQSDPSAQAQTGTSETTDRGPGQEGQPQDPGQSGASGASGAGAEPGAADLGSGDLSGDEEAPLESAAGEDGPDPAGSEGADSLAAHRGEGPAEDTSVGVAPGADAAALDPAERERIQSLEAQLRRVPDDPAGLLRQRFLLQHLRREGRLQ